MHKDTIIIVHPFASDKILYETIKARGYKIITLITNFDRNWIQQCLPTINEHSDFILRVQGNEKVDIPLIEKTIKDNDLAIAAVINGFDYSVHYSDALTNHFLGTHIELDFSVIRTNKYLVNETLKKAGIRHIKSILISSIADLEKKQSEISKLKLPLIIKPASDSAASRDIVVLEDIENLSLQVAKLFTRPSTFHEKPHQYLLIQEYIDGVEFSVNSAIYNSQYYLASVFKFAREKNRRLYSYSLDEEARKEIEILVKYDQQCLNALHVSYGIMHNDYILDKDEHAYLIEVNSRLTGVEIPRLSTLCYGTNELTTFLDIIEHIPVRTFKYNQILGYGAVPRFINLFKEKAHKLDLSNVKSQYEIVAFRPDIIDIKTNPDELVRVSAGILMFNKEKNILFQDINDLFKKEREGTLFI